MWNNAIKQWDAHNKQRGNSCQVSAEQYYLESSMQSFPLHILSSFFRTITEDGRILNSIQWEKSRECRLNSFLLSHTNKQHLRPQLCFKQPGLKGSEVSRMHVFRCMYISKESSKFFVFFCAVMLHEQRLGRSVVN